MKTLSLIKYLALVVAVGCGAAPGTYPGPSEEGLVSPPAAPTAQAGARTGILHLASGAIEVPYEIVDGEAIHDGDIVLGDAEVVAHEKAEWDANRRGAGAATGPGLHTQSFTITAGAEPARLWQNEVPYIINAGVDSGLVHQAMDAWQSHWSFGPEAGATMPVFYDVAAWCPGNNCPVSKYLVFVNIAGGRCSSTIGRASGSSPYQYVRVGVDNTDKLKCITHELGHVLGLYHEHQRPDRGTYVNVTAPGDANFASDYGNPPPGGTPTKTGRYDFESIMHYRNGLTLKAPLNGKPIPPIAASSISAGDLAGVYALYGVGAGEATVAFGGTTSRNQRDIAAAWGPTERALAVIGLDQALYINETAGCGSPTSFCNGWQGKGGYATSSPGLAVKPGGGVIAVVLGDGGQTVCMWETGPGWTCDGNWGFPTWGGWGGVPGYTVSYGATPAVIAQNGGYVFVTVKACKSNGQCQLVMNERLGTSWSGWWLEGGANVQGASALATSDSTSLKTVYTAGSSNDYAVFANYNELGIPSYGTKPLAGIDEPGVSVCSRAPGEYDIFVHGRDDLIWGIHSKNGVLSNNWHSYGGPVDSLPACAAVYRDANKANAPLPLYFQQKNGFFDVSLCTPPDYKCSYDPVPWPGEDGLVWTKYVVPRVFPE